MQFQLELDSDSHAMQLQHVEGSGMSGSLTNEDRHTSQKSEQ